MKKISKLGFLSILLVVLMFSSTVAFAEEGESIGVTPVNEGGELLFLELVLHLPLII
ncbi:MULTISPECIES: hypothetical protein [unclassified Peribacillus]|uniref:hypothetical protein n=1 Tax=unclassified Peribacillus TaxID=2675266 RepID=UPI00366AA3DB